MAYASSFDTVVIDGYIDLAADFDAEFGAFLAIKDYTYPIYTGETTITPRAEEQVLQTEHTTVMGDITVEEIPYTEVSNPSGGLTVSIG